MAALKIKEVQRQLKLKLEALQTSKSAQGQPQAQLKYRRQEERQHMFVEEIHEKQVKMSLDRFKTDMAAERTSPSPAKDTKQDCPAAKTPCTCEHPPPPVPFQAAHLCSPKPTLILPPPKRSLTTKPQTRRSCKRK